MDPVESSFDGMQQVERLRQRIQHARTPSEMERWTAELLQVSTLLASQVSPSEARTSPEGARRRLGRSSYAQPPEATGRRTSGLEAAPMESAPAAAARAAIEVEATLHWSRLPTGIAHVLDPAVNPLIQYHVQPPASGLQRLRLRTHVEGYSAHAVDTVELAQGDAPRTVSHLPTMFPDAIRKLHEATQATVHVEVQDLDAPGAEFRVQSHATMRTCLLPTTTAVLAQRDPATGAHQDLTNYLACWVTPNADEVMDVLREAAGRVADGQMVGYQVDPAGVEQQVRALFEALRARGVAYVNSVLAIGIDGYQTQRIRLPREALARRSANCIDGTALYASVLEAASLQPGIVVVPGHAFLAWRPQRPGVPGAAPWDFLETTLTMTHDFQHALEQGRRTYQHAAAQGRAQIVDIGACRRQGLLPLD